MSARIFGRIANATVTAVIRYAVRNPNVRKVLRKPIGIGTPDRSANTTITICQPLFCSRLSLGVFYTKKITQIILIRVNV